MVVLVHCDVYSHCVVREFGSFAGLVVHSVCMVCLAGGRSEAGQ